jgi:DNA-binding transcriptional MerR regulator
MPLKIGELAKRIGLTVRTLHHYDAIGLVKPSTRSDSGYRLYNRDDVARLHRIQALRGLGLSLAETGALLDGEGAELTTVIRQQITSLQRQITQAVDLRDRLQAMEVQLQGADEPDIDEWLSTLGMMATRRKYFAQSELEALYRQKEFGDDAEKWSAMVAEVRGLMDRQISPQSAAAKTIALRWLALQKKTMIDDPRIFLKLGAMHRAEFNVQALTGVDGFLLDYVLLAVHEIRCDIYARYVNPEELDHYRRHFVKGAQRWLEVFAEARQLMEQGVAPEHPDAQAIFGKWKTLFQDTWGKDPATRNKVQNALQDHPDLRIGSGLTPDMQKYVNQGMALYAANAVAGRA